MTRALRSFVIATGVAALITAPAAAQERSATRQGFELPANSAKRILVFRPAVRVGAQSTGGMFEPNADWTDKATRNIAAALAKLQAALGNTVVAAPEAYGDDARHWSRNICALFAAVSRRGDRISVLRGQPAAHQEARQQGRRVRLVARRRACATLPGAKDADYALFIYNKDAYGSTGPQDAAGACARSARASAVKSGEHMGYAGLVDLQDRRPAVAQRRRRDGRRRARRARAPRSASASCSRSFRAATARASCRRPRP